MECLWQDAKDQSLTAARMDDTLFHMDLIQSQMATRHLNDTATKVCRNLQLLLVDALRVDLHSQIQTTARAMCPTDM